MIDKTSRATGDGARPSHREIVAQLAGAQKSAKGAPAYSRFVNRPLGRQFAAVAFRASRTPNW